MTGEWRWYLAQRVTGRSRAPRNAVSELAGSQVLDKPRDTGKEARRDRGACIDLNFRMR